MLAKLDCVGCKSRQGMVHPLSLRLMSPLQEQVLMGQHHVMRSLPW